MSYSKILVLAFGITGAALAAACSDDNGPGGGTAGTSAGGSGGDNGGDDGCNTDYSRLAGGDPVSLQDDLMPVFGLSCTQSQCHNDQHRKAQLYLGPRCQFEDGACQFIDTPLTQADLDEVHQNLLAESTTVAGVQRVDPGNADGSFLLQKLAGIHNDQGHACTPQDANATECGDEMPPGQALCDQRNGQDRFDLFVRWVLQGAQNN